MSDTARFVRPRLVRSELDRALGMREPVLLRFLQFDFLGFDVQDTNMVIRAYYGPKETFLLDDVNELGYRVRLPVPCSTAWNCVRIPWDDLEADFYKVSSNFVFSQGSNTHCTVFLKKGATVETTENTRFLYPCGEVWSVYFDKGTKFVVLARDDDTNEIILRPKAGGREIRLHITNARFFEEVQEVLPENLPAKDGVDQPEAMLQREVHELRALISEQNLLIEHQKKSYSDLFTKYQTTLTRNFARVSGDDESLQSSMLDNLLDMALCPILSDTPGPGDIRVLQNGQLVSNSGWNHYTSSLAETTTPRCPLTRDQITQKPITCKPLQNVIDALRNIKDMQVKRSVSGGVDEARSDAKRRRG